MPKKPDRTYAGHKARWGNCTRCMLHECRGRIVLARGVIPTEVLLLGEAPGQSEDVLGRPFVGPAGDLLDEMIEEAERMSRPVGKLFTNLVGCIPRDVERGSSYKLSEPPPESIEACSPRLQELVNLSKPTAIVMIGKLAQKWCPKLIDYDFEHSLDIIHPAAILRMDLSQRGLAEQRTTIQLRDLFEKV